MSLLRLLSATIALNVALGILASHSAFAAYQYTYTSEPFQYVENDFVRGHIYNISTDSILKIVITSETLLDTYLDDPLASATYDFTVEGFTSHAKPDGMYGNSLVASQLLIRDLGSDGLPTSWYLNYTETIYTSPDMQNKIGMGYYSDDELTQFAYSVTDGGNFNHIYAAGAPGKWEITQISSPVPENDKYAMLLAGLGIIGLTVRRRSSGG